MKLRLTAERRGTGAREIRSVAPGTVSIGRAPGNDWVLADPDRHLSKTHCVIGWQSGRFVLTDLSTNGVFVNGAREPLGRNNQVVLTDGDQFTMGEYVVSVAEQPGDAQAGFAAEREDPLGGDPLGGDPLGSGPAALDPLGDSDPFGPDAGAAAGFSHPFPAVQPNVRRDDPFAIADRQRGAGLDDDLFGGPPQPGWSGAAQPDHLDAPFQAFRPPPPVAPPQPFQAIDIDALLGDEPIGAAPAAPAEASRSTLSIADPPPPDSEQIPDGRPPAAAAATAPAASAAEPAALVAAFLEGAGLPQLRLATDSEASMRHAGAILRAMVEGLREVLISRSAIKNDLRVEQTMLRARDNNALKFSVTAEEALAALLMPNRPGYKPPLDAVREAYDDVRQHEMAVMAGVQSALGSLLKRFDPASLETRLQRGFLDGVLPGARKARFWEAFCQTYGEIAREAEDDFQALFGREFGRGYEQQLKKF